MENELINNLDLLLNLDELEQEEIWDEAIRNNTELLNNIQEEVK
jgi:hypothetical protein